MAIVAPMPVRHPQNSFGHIHHDPKRRNSETARNISTAPVVGRSASSTATSRRPLTTLEDIAQEIQQSLRLSTSPSGAFNYLGGDVYGSTPLQKSRSLPNNFNRTLTKSSLSSPKAPLRKAKSVRFADSQGLPLVEAVHQLTHKDSSYTANKIVPYDDQDDILSRQPLILAGVPSPSTSARTNLTLPTSLPSGISPVSSPGQSSPVKHKHIFRFKQPSLEPDFFVRVKTESVVLESLREEPRSLHGIVRVANLAYSKEVAIRWTHDGWRTSHDTCCVFCSNDGDTDRFAFELPINGDDVSFAIRYRVLNEEYWDNNRGSNYTVASKSIA